MAQVFSAPAGYEAPAFDYRADWQAQEQAYLDRLSDLCKHNGTNPLLGEVVRWQRADGYACYMVWQTKPLQLIHLDIADGYSVEEPLLRGLRLADIRDMVEREKRLREFFARKSEDLRTD